MDNLAILTLSSYGLILSIIDYFGTKKVQREIDIFIFLIGTCSLIGYFYANLMILVQFGVNIIFGIFIIIVFGVIGPWYIYNKRIGNLE